MLQLNSFFLVILKAIALRIRILSNCQLFVKK